MYIFGYVRVSALSRVVVLKVNARFSFSKEYTVLKKKCFKT